jgi:salicylate hydroxylase
MAIEMTSPKFKVVIWYVYLLNLHELLGFTVVHDLCSGGGVGGLTLAVALSKYPDIQVELFEAAKSFTEVGAGIGLWPRAFKVKAFSQTFQAKPQPHRA